MPSFLPTSTPTASPTASPTKASVVASLPAPKEPTTKGTSAIVEKEAPSPNSTISSSSSGNENMSKGAIAAIVLAVLCVTALIGYHAQRKYQRNASSTNESESEHDNKICDDDTASRESRDVEGTEELIGQIPCRSESHDSDSAVMGEHYNASPRVLTVRQGPDATDEQLVLNAIKQHKEQVSRGQSRRERDSSSACTLSEVGIEVEGGGIPVVE
mmetsp:Transcript_35428/g.71797  ORF Transcript_35428/g.71797 Transcript_35428/m.71797 type:complete len:215 (-) Transcript_35428:366-1010(-)